MHGAWLSCFTSLTVQPLLGSGGGGGGGDAVLQFMIGAVSMRWLALMAHIEYSVMYSTRLIFANRPYVPIPALSALLPVCSILQFARLVVVLVRSALR